MDAPDARQGGAVAPAVETVNLARSYGAREALRGVSFVVARGEIFGLLGPNGSGKTTALRILSTLLAPSGGRASVLGWDVVREAASVRRRIGVVFQSPSVDRELSAAENLWHQGHLYGLHGRELRRRIDDALGRMGLADRARERVDRLSGGLRRRVELAKGLLHAPDLLLLDEPSTGLDPGARRDLWAYYEEVRRRDGTTVVLTTHLLDEAERCDRVAILDRGAIVGLDSPGALKAEMGPEVVTVRKPTLEDVFVRRTGHGFWESGERGGGAAS